MRRKTFPKWPSWRWSADGSEGRSFAGPEDVPEGWITHEQRIALRDGAQPAPNDLEALRAALDAKGIPYHHKAGVKRLSELLAEADA